MTQQQHNMQMNLCDVYVSFLKQFCGKYQRNDHVLKEIMGYSD